ncbi:MAG: VCBS repeat-containing protein [Kineothrix sp.]|nr:VCBS repeat-containing protein [Kineothrix sp.]NBI92694.1 VCBS repeat-containing protein [Lachnospiraceae bacterium]
MDENYGRLILLFAASDGEILYKTEQLATNNCYLGQIKQPNQGISAVSFQDVNGDGLVDIVLITSCVNEGGDYAGKTYKVGDVLFQNKDGTGFYRDYRISDKINRFSMNKSIDLIAAFVREGKSTEFLYTATTLKELQDAGLKIISEQCYFRDFEKLGRLQVVPGVYSIAEYGFFMIYLVNEQGYIVWSLQPMGEYDNLYALKGIRCWDIDGDGLKDIIVLARYSYEGSGHELIVKTDYAIYYQRTGGFSADTEIRDSYRCSDEVSMEELIEKARAYWGW